MDTGKPGNILIVEDENKISDVVAMYLEREGFSVTAADTGEKALNILKQPFDLIVLDLMLPDFSGEELCRIIRETSDVPIIMLTAKSGEEDRIRGLGMGADDYVVKPFSPRELVLRIKKILQRGRAVAEEQDLVKFGDLVIDSPRHLVTWKGKSIDLTATEFKLLAILAQRRGRVQSRDQLLRDVWEYNSLVDTRTVDTHMRRLRDKLGPASKFLDTVRGVGYRFVEG
jgi:DNA-binding response OmpR family regulator